MAQLTRRRAAGAWHTVAGHCHKQVSETVSRLIQTKRRGDLALWRDLFLAGRPTAESQAASGVPRPGIRARANVVRNATETVVSRVAANQPKPWFVTVGGNWKSQRRAKKRTRFVEGDWERIGADRLRRDMILDAGIYGTGVIKVVPDFEKGSVEWARVWCGDVFTHKREERAGCIRTMYQIAFVDREVAKSRWPRHQADIERANAADMALLAQSGAAEDGDDDLIAVYEAWRLPISHSGGEASGGRHVICIDTATLEDEEWDEDFFPFVLYPMTDDPESIWGIGYPERMAGGQAEQNALSELASDVARMMTPKYVFANGSRLTVDQTSNDIEVWYVSGEMPQILSAEANILGIMNAAAIQRQSLYAIEGISEQSAEGTSPDNLTSGKAKLVHRDIEAQRHREAVKRSEEATVQLARLHVWACEKLCEAEVDLRASHGKSMLEVLRYEDVRPSDDEEDDMIRVAPVSALASDPAGKLAQLNEMLAAQVITPAEWRELYDLPDLDRSNDLAFAGRELARMLVEKALDGETDIPATRACDLEFLIDYAWKVHARSQLEGATTEDLEKVRNLAGHAQALLDQQKAAMVAALPSPPPMPGPGGGVPMPQAAAQPPIEPMGIQGIVP